MKHDPAMLTAVNRLAGTVDALHALPLIQPLERRALIRVLRWQHAAATEGLPTARSRAEAAAVRRAVAAGLVASSGQTQGTRHRLTVAGVAVSTPCESWRAAGALLRRIAAAQDASDVTLPHRPADRLCMPWHLLPEAGRWLERAERTAAAWQSYRDALVVLDSAILPLLACGYVRRSVCEGGQLWALVVTVAGREALALPWPEAAASYDFAAWSAGWDRGARLAQSVPPPEASTILPRLLPASAWAD